MSSSIIFWSFSLSNFWRWKVKWNSIVDICGFCFMYLGTHLLVNSSACNLFVVSAFPDTRLTSFGNLCYFGGMFRDESFGLSFFCFANVFGLEMMNIHSFLIWDHYGQRACLFYHPYESSKWRWEFCLFRLKIATHLNDSSRWVSEI